VTDTVLLLCYHYDPAAGKYSLAILNAVRIGFVGTVTGFLAFLFVSLRRERTDEQSTEMTMRTSGASEPRERSAPAQRRARERAGEPEGRSPSDIR
jgi:hypothetical protein